jgi:hypothetical protein
MNNGLYSDIEFSDLINYQSQEAFFGMGVAPLGNNTPVKVYDSGVRTGGFWSVCFPSDFVVVGHNPENADMSNPRGEIVGERFYMQAEDALGHRRTYGGYYETLEAAEATYAFLTPAVEFWEETRPCYGSEAWTADVEADEVEMERADEHASNFLNFRYEC